jgi:hypothetical protein
MSTLTEAQKQTRRDSATAWNRERRSTEEGRVLLNERATVSRQRRYQGDPAWRTAYISKTRLRQRDARDRIDAIKIARGCMDCGYNESAVALDFDHLPEFDKLFTIGNNAQRSWAAIEAEIAKCDVVCANCHRIRTNRRAQS